MKRCPKGHNVDLEKLEIECPFCTTVRHALMVKSVLFIILGLGVFGYAISAVGGGVTALRLGEVLVWIPAWAGAVVASFGNRHLLPWGLLGYLFGGLFVRLPAGAPAYQTVVDIFKYFDLAQATDVHQRTGYLVMGFVEGLVLGLLAIVLETFIRRIVNEPDPPQAPWFIKPVHKPEET